MYMCPFAFAPADPEQDEEESKVGRGMVCTAPLPARDAPLVRRSNTQGHEMAEQLTTAKVRACVRARLHRTDSLIARSRAGRVRGVCFACA
jgi:hypothetical protein